MFASLTAIDCVAGSCGCPWPAATFSSVQITSTAKVEQRVDLRAPSKAQPIYGWADSLGYRIGTQAAHHAGDLAETDHIAAGQDVAGHRLAVDGGCTNWPGQASNGHTQTAAYQLGVQQRDRRVIQADMAIGTATDCRYLAGQRNDDRADLQVRSAYVHLGRRLADSRCGGRPAVAGDSVNRSGC